MPKVSNVEPGHLRERYLDADAEERGAILECDAGLGRAEAEARAAEEFPELPEFLRRLGVRAAKEGYQGAWCGAKAEG